MKVAGFIVLLLLFQESVGQSRLCGAVLDNAIQTVCEATGFNTRLKKSDIFEPFSALGDIVLSDEVNMMAKIRRRRDGIVDECCRLKGCTYAELLSYCKRE
ncbi:insulin-like peptide 3 [Haematobia irritans]|uniref:insulin-like peptide 3 n=1 Tax=Haematobia irritans TaxID=7368 RepID=UPI003F504390